MWRNTHQKKHMAAMAQISPIEKKNAAKKRFQWAIWSGLPVCKGAMCTYLNGT